MKAALILTSLFLFASLMGCSEDLSVSEPFDHSAGQTKGPGDGRNLKLVCSFDELSVSACNEFLAENKAVYSNPPLEMISNYWVTFDVYTDANKMSNSYIPMVQIFKDNENVFESSAYPNENGEIITHVQVALENVRFTELAIHISLCQGDDPTVRNEDALTTLKLTKIGIYKEN